MIAEDWDKPLLDELRQCGDPDADAVAARYYSLVGDDPARMFRGMARGVDAPVPADADAVLAAYYADAPPLPGWVDPAQLARGAEFFAQWGLEIGLGLFCFSLPVGYAAAPAAHVLDLTSRLETDAKRRIYETAQMVLDVTAPDALWPGAQGYLTARRVRLMHAGIRHLVLNDPRVLHRAVSSGDARGCWCSPDWGVPISQEHLVGALLTFGHSILGVLDALGVDYDERDAAAYLHLWSVVGHLLGIRPDVLPIDRATGDRIDELVRPRNLAATAAGVDLTAALLDVIDTSGPDGILGALPAVMMRHLLGDEVADMLALPPGGWVEHALAQFNPILKLLSTVDGAPGLAGFARWLSRALLEQFVRWERGPSRPAFAVPAHLAEQWQLTPA